MSTIMLDSNATDRLARQYENVIRRSNPRDAEIETRRFVSYLCDRLERNNHALMAAARNRRPDHIFTSALASRQGENVLMTCMFMLNELATRVGLPKLAEYLAATETKAGRALSRRLGSRPNSGLNAVSVRFSAGDSSSGTRQCVTKPAPFAGTNTVIADYRFRGSYPGAMRVGIVIENEGYRTSHFVGAHVKLYARYDRGDIWTPTAGNAFAFLDRVAPMEAQVLALRGFDCMDLIRGADKQNRDPQWIRVLARLV
jgi:hypothetical protein